MLKTDMVVLFLYKKMAKKQFQLLERGWNDRVWLEWPSESLGRSLLGQRCALTDR
jgi:hypothetical protein